SLTLEDFMDMGARGWIPILNNPNDPEGGIGIPLYADSRIQLLWELERAGYAADELRAIASWEESTIDSVLTTDEFAYVDDDLELTIQHMRGMLLQAERESRDTVTVDLLGNPVSRNRFERKLLLLERFREGGIPEKYQYFIAKVAYRVRAFTEMGRIELLEMDRAMIRGGYSYFIVSNRDWRSTTQSFIFNIVKIHWDKTIKVGLA